MLAEIDRIALGRQAVTHTIRAFVIISTDVPLRKDGEPRADIRPNDTGVAIYFKRKGKQVCMACDKYDAVWKNMRALQKTIEALRGIERWGSTQLLDRAFTGFAALAEKTGPSCWDVLGLIPAGGDDVSLSEGDIMSAFWKKAKTAHPDAGGTHEAFVELSNAKDIALATIKT